MFFGGCQERSEFSQRVAMRNFWKIVPVMTVMLFSGCGDATRDVRSKERRCSNSSTIENGPAAITRHSLNAFSTISAPSTPPLHSETSSGNVQTSPHSLPRTNNNTTTRDPQSPYANPVPGKTGLVTSPFAPYAGYVDVRGYPSGQEVKCPYTGRLFRVP